LGAVLGNDDLDALRSAPVAQIDHASLQERASHGQSPLAKIRTTAGPSVGRVQLLDDMRLILERVPVTRRRFAFRGPAAENALHWIGKHAERCTLIVYRCHNGVLIIARVLMLVADYNRVPPGDSRCDHGMTAQQGCHAGSEFGMAVVTPPDPCADIGRKAKARMVRGGDLANQTVNRADFHAGSCSPCSLGEHRTGSVGVRKDQWSAGAAR
jgi:hypothetical protein